MKLPNLNDNTYSMMNRIKQTVFGYFGKEQPNEDKVSPRINLRMCGYVQFKVNGEIINYIEVNQTRLFFKAFNENQTVQTLQDQYKWCHGKEMELESDTVKISPKMPLSEILTSTASRQVFENIANKIDKKEEIKVEDIPEENKKIFQEIVKKCNDFHCKIHINYGPGKPLQTGLKVTETLTFNKIIEMMNERAYVKGKDIDFENQEGEKVELSVYDIPFKDLQMKQNFFNVRYSSRNSLIRGNTLVSIYGAELDSVPIERLESLEKIALVSYNPDQNRIVLSKMMNFKRDLVSRYYRIVLCPIIEASLNKEKETIIEATGDFRICVLSQFQMIWLPVSKLNEEHIVQGIDNLENAAAFKIIKIDVMTLEEPEYFYGLQSLPEHQFIANSIICHNSDSYTIQAHYIYHQRKEVKPIRFYRHQKLSKYFDGMICEVGGYRLNNNHTFGDYQLDQIQIMYVYGKDKVIPPRRERTISQWKKESVDEQSLDEKQKQKFSSKLDEEYFGIYGQRIIPYSEIKRIQQHQEDKIINILVAYRLYFQRTNYYLNNKPKYSHLQDQAYNQNLKFQDTKQFQNILKNDKLSLTRKQLTAIYVYTRPEVFGKLNSYLRVGYIQKTDELANKKYLPYVGWISNGVSKTNKYKGKVFRGMNNIDLNKALGLDNNKKCIDIKGKKEHMMEESQTGKAEEQAKIVIFTAFTSTSKSQAVARSFATNGLPTTKSQGVNTMLTIHVQNGHEVEDYSQFQNEEQVLILPFTYFLLNSWSREGKMQTAELEEIPMPKTNLNKIVFWVDDQPQNNLKTIKDKFEPQGIEVVQITTTRIMEIILSNFFAFFKLLGRKVVIISDMVRTEYGVKNYTAGVDLFLQIFNIHGLSNKAIIFATDGQRARANLKEKGVIGGNWVVLVEEKALIAEVLKEFQNM